MQLMQLVTAQKNLKSIENLKDRYGEQIAEKRKKDEQKKEDEFAVLRFQK